MTIKWKVNNSEHGWVASVPPFSLSVGKADRDLRNREVFWQCHWQDNWQNGTADTVEQAKTAAIRCAVALCRKALEQLEGAP